jgi:flagellar protein FlgJ
MKPEDFIAALAPAARASMARTKIPASFTIAQAALESGWGASKLTVSAKNLFNIKADSAWRGPMLRMPSTECVAGHDVLQPAAWRVYPDWLASIEDHANFLLPTTNPRYAPAFARCDNGEAFAVAVAAAGYATDPNYAAKLIATMRSHNLKQFDQPQGVKP